MGRSNIKCSPETLEQLKEQKRDGESWDRLLQRAVDGLEANANAGDPIGEYRGAKVFTTDEAIGNQEGRVEIYENWVRVRGLNGLWIPREQVEQVHEH